jgi:hypothetical protein
MTAFTLPPTSVLVAQAVAALLWVAAYVIWARVFYAVIDPMLRAQLGKRVNAEVIWLYRRGSLYASPSSFTLRRSTWSWGLAGDRENAAARRARVRGVRDLRAGDRGALAHRGAQLRRALAPHAVGGRGAAAVLPHHPALHALLGRPASGAGDDAAVDR